MLDIGRMNAAPVPPDAGAEISLGWTPVIPTTTCWPTPSRPSFCWQHSRR